MAERSYEPVEVSEDILDRFKKLPVATIWHYTWQRHKFRF